MADSIMATEMNSKVIVVNEEEEVRTCCEKCQGEGMVFVSKERAKELEEQELLEGLCPFGDKCAGESDEESDADSTMNTEIYDTVLSEIKQSFKHYYHENYEGEEFEEFKDTFLQEIYNSSEDVEIKKDYHYLLFFLHTIKEELYQGHVTFSDWDNPQKIVNLGYYIIAKNELYNIQKTELYCDNIASINEFKTKPIYTQFDLCVAKVEGWRQGINYDCRVSNTLNYIKNQFDHLTKEQMKLVFEEVESGFIWDIETDEIKDEDEEESDSD
jgi:hypothetical protein